MLDTLLDSWSIDRVKAHREAVVLFFFLLGCHMVGDRLTSDSCLLFCCWCCCCYHAYTDMHNSRDEQVRVRWKKGDLQGSGWKEQSGHSCEG
jgi:hypothetical protein